jgi:hypothetical protein
MMKWFGGRGPKPRAGHSLLASRRDVERERTGKEPPMSTTSSPRPPLNDVRAITRREIIFIIIDFLPS